MIQSFFGSSQLSQFMDQTNPLAELTHKRRLSRPRARRAHARPRRLRGARRALHALRAHVPDRDAGRPEHRADLVALDLRAGQRARLPRDAVPQGEGRGRLAERSIEFLSADQEDKYIIAQANAPLDKQGELPARDQVACRFKGEFPLVPPEEVHYMDVSPMQLVSPAAALIPFLEHDDANRALMGSNMQRQAVPLLITEPPLVGTGLERKVAEDSGAMIARQARRAWSSRSAGDADRGPVPTATRQSSVHDFTDDCRARHLQPDQVQALEPGHLHQPEAARARRASG